MGVALYPEDGTDEITLAKSADEAMYQAKQDGRDMVRLAS
jgi:GGDEF domain-containing protein